MKTGFGHINQDTVVALSKYGKNPFKISKTRMILKLDMDHCGLKIYKVYINDEPRLILAYFTARSYLVKIAHCTYFFF